MWLVENLLELKLGRPVLIEKNLLQNNWAHGQSGVAVLLKSSGYAPWTETTDVTMRHNIAKDSVSGRAISGALDGKGIPASHFDIHDNTFVNIVSGGAAPR